LDDFLGAAPDRADGAGLPEFIAREFREFLTWGVLTRDFARVRCERCALGRLVPFSSGLNLNVHVHTLALDGVFVRYNVPVAGGSSPKRVATIAGRDSIGPARLATGVQAPWLGANNGLCDS